MRKKMMKRVVQLFACFAFVIPHPANGDGVCLPPSAATIARSTNDLWQAERFTELDTYVTDLLTRFPGYVPVKVAASFVKQVVRGEWIDARTQLDAVLTHLSGRTEHDEFAARVQVARMRLDTVIQNLESKGKTFPTAADPQVMKNMFDEIAPPMPSGNRPPPPTLDLVGPAPEEFVGDTGATPSVSIAAPLNGALVTAGSPVGVSVSVANGPVPICKVDIYDGPTLVGTDTESPYSLTWIPGSGDHDLKGVATDYKNRVGQSALVRVTAQ